jgi:c(7)-type cytochrome triheme protein
MREFFILLVWLLVLAAPALAVVGGGDITLPGGDAGKVVFSHERHVADLKLNCQECHPGLYLDAGQHKPVTMEEMGKGKSCGACHDGKRAFSALGDCNRCHGK